MPRVKNISTDTTLSVNTIDGRVIQLRPNQEADVRDYQSLMRPYMTLISHEPFFETVGASGETQIDSVIPYEIPMAGIKQLELSCNANFKVVYNGDDRPVNSQTVAAGQLLRVDNRDSAYFRVDVYSLAGNPTLIYSANTVWVDV